MIRFLHVHKVIRVIKLAHTCKNRQPCKKVKGIHDKKRKPESKVFSETLGLTLTHRQ